MRDTMRPIHTSEPVVGTRDEPSRASHTYTCQATPWRGSEPLFTPIFTPQNSAPQATKLTRRDPVAGAARARATFATFTFHSYFFLSHSLLQVVLTSIRQNKLK